MTILVTGAAGFIGSNFVLDWFSQSDEDLVTLDLLTYAGDLENLSPLRNNSHHHFFQGNIADRHFVSELLKKYHIRAVVHFAAESHVDRAILKPDYFIETNIVGTFHLLECIRDYWCHLNEDLKKAFRFLHVSSDEVYGSLDYNAPPFCENHRYYPNNPYSASKAASDHLVYAWYRTYGLPILITNSSNNFGPRQNMEKLIPSCILNAINNEPIRIYGDGKHIRDWLYVEDHCRAIRLVLEKGGIGSTYNIGGSNEKTNIEVAITLCKKLDEIRPKKDGKNFQEQINFVKDRSGHDFRYAMDSSKIKKELGWIPKESFESGILKTLNWYLEKNRFFLDQII
jgi:dTDP-glucose 4,6-dehydratase